MREANAGAHMITWPSKRTLAKVVALTLLALAALTFDWRVAELRERSRGDDFFQFWAAGRAILRGDDPYEPETWRQIYEQEGRWRWQTDQPVSLYPLWTAFVFVPLARLPVSWAALVWAVISELLVVLSAGLIIRGLGWNKYEAWLPLMIAILITFEPISLTILFGQLGILLLALICGVFYCLTHSRNGTAGILLGFTLIKPQLLMLVIPTLLLVAAWQRKWSFIAAFAATSMGLMASSWLLAPGWLSRWQGNLVATANVRLVMSPTGWGFSHTLVTALGRPDLWAIVSVPVCLSLVGTVGWLWYATRNDLQRGDRLAPFLSFTMIASLLVSPYVLSYDFALLLFPTLTCVWLIQPLPSSTRRRLLASLLGCAAFLPWALLALSAQTGQETTTILFPVGLLAVLVVGRLARGRWQEKAATPEGHEELPTTWRQMEV